MKKDTQATSGGVSYHEVDAENETQRLDNFLLRYLKGVPRSLVYRLVRSGQVRVNSGRVSPGYRLRAGDRVRIPPVSRSQSVQPKPEGVDWIASCIVYEDHRLIVLDKPAGMAVHGGGSVSFGCIEALRSLRPHDRLELAHRLDRQTSGCLLIAKRPSALRMLHEVLRGGAVRKVYFALVQGAWPAGLETVDTPLKVQHASSHASVRADRDGKPALSRFRVMERLGGRASTQVTASLVEVSIETGRTHQIRVHAADSGHPVAGDDRYGDRAFNAAMESAGLSRMFLHASRIAFEWPDSGEEFSIGTPLPDTLERVLDSLRSSG